ncbi:unnamed protein product [Ceutorhynchus assimilis]|uniref:Peptidase S1 domain-containing protein n=1 Tax=Ceutorhynchus assimilis TaxID=467358 RepID=A0A9N9MKP1_9CUCU|nr:unnamed protein product [Ceutorhynchus assimilis]
MKFAIVFVACCLLGAFVAAEEEHEFIDWHHLKPLNLHVEPIGPVPESTGTRIIGGSVAPRNAFPYQVALIINNSGFCGGSIISRNWILTAAHCVDTGTRFQVIAGAHNPSTNEPSQVRMAAKSRVVHSEWNRSRLQNDIAVLEVPNIPIGKPGIDSIRLAPSNAGTYAGSKSVLSGWGRTSDASTSIASKLQYVHLSIITNRVCQNSFGLNVRTTNICTSGVGRVGACNGDSGGPLVVDGVEVGVVSFGNGNCERGSPTVYARVSSYRAWIKQNTGV